MNNQNLSIVAVDSAALMHRFIRLPSRLHADDPNWITPLDMEREEAFSTKKNPLFQTTEVQFWLAQRDGRDVGRISAQIKRDPAVRGDSGQFGLIAAEDDPAVFAVLFETAEAWLRARGVRNILGPFNLSINEETGLLVDGFDTPPMLLMGHDKPYIGGRLEALGYSKAKDVYAYLHDITQPLPRAVQTLLQRPLPPGYVLRPMSFKRYEQDIQSITEIFNDAWSENWQFEALTPADTAHMAKAMKPILNERLVWFVDVDGEPAGFGVGLPNINAALTGLNGKLLPFGWAKLLWRLKVRGVTSARVPLMGIKRKYLNGLGGALLPFVIIDALRREGLKLGYREVELSWILEDNLPMNRININLGAKAYKTYRLYGKTLSP